MTPIWHPSPNFGPRKNCVAPNLIVIHYTAMGSAKAALDRLCDPEFEVSAHYLIGQNGEIWQMVDETHRAWHAGRGAWAGCCDVNSTSIGIELCNTGKAPFPKMQMKRLIALLRNILKRYDLPPTSVIGHSDLAPDRKYDPGRLFDWNWLHDAHVGISRPLCDVVPNSLSFLDAAKQFGYSIEFDEHVILDAFRQRFRPFASGPICEADRQLISQLAVSYPVDGGGGRG